VFTSFTHLVANASGWAYGIVFLLAFLDAVFPVVPSETAVITAGVVAASGDLFLPLVIVLAAAGAFLGDNTAYWIGRKFGGWVVERFLSGEKARRRLEWAERQIRERGGQLIVIGRFVPGGRTAITLSAGLLHYSWPRFLVLDALAGSIWALYASFLGYFGGRAFEHEAWKGLLLALGIGFAMAGAIEAGRWIVKRVRG
jgi:membrane protein DedA with SNARE-associated domain